jgi:hypothetical protein
MTILQDILAAVNWNIRVTENFRTVSAAGLYGQDPVTTTGLTFGFKGGQFSGNTVADGTVALTPSATNYVVANRSTGAVSAATTTTNWLNSGSYLQLFQVVTGTASITTATDFRQAFGAAVASSFTGGTLASALNEAPPVTIASSSTPAIGAAAANTINLSGTTTVTGFDTIAAGAIRRVIFGGILTLTYNATSLILPTAANITTAAGDVATFESLGSGNWKCIDYQTASGAALAGGGGGGLTGATATLNTTGTNATTNVTQIIASGGTSNQSIALSPKANGGLYGQLPDGTATGGNARGLIAVDWQLQRTAATQIASGSGSTISGGVNNTSSSQNSTVVGGSGNTASGQYSVAGGLSSQASGNYSVALGQTAIASGSPSYVLGYNSSALAAYSVALGGYASSRTTIGVFAFASQALSLGAAQYRQLIPVASTSSATAAAMLSDSTGSQSANNQMSVPTGCASAFNATVVAHNTSTGDCARWTIKGLAKNVGGTLTLVGTPTSTLDFNDTAAASWTCVASADNTNKCIAFTVTGAASTTIKWVANVETVEVI